MDALLKMENYIFFGDLDSLEYVYLIHRVNELRTLFADQEETAEIGMEPVELCTPTFSIAQCTIISIIFIMRDEAKIDEAKTYSFLPFALDMSKFSGRII